MSQISLDALPEQKAQIVLESAFELCREHPENALHIAHEAVKDSDPALAAHTLYAVGQHYYQQNHPTNAQRAFDKALDYATICGRASLALEIYISLGQTLIDLGQFEDAGQTLELGLQIAKRLNAPEDEVEACILLAVINNYQGHYAKALKHLKLSLPMAKTHQLNEKIARIYNNMGSNYNALGLYAEALEALKNASLLIHEHMPKSRHEIINLINAGQVYVAMKNFKNAEMFFTRAYNLSVDIHNIFFQSASLNNKAESHFQNQNFEAAQKDFQQGLSLAQRESLRYHEIYNLFGLGQVHFELKAYQKSLKYFSEALNLAHTLGDLQAEIDARLYIAKNHIARRKLTNALEILNETQSIKLDNYPKALAEIQRLYADVYAQQKDFEKAFYHHQCYHTLQVKLINKESHQKTQELAIQFEVEQAHQEAEDYRLRTEIEHIARQKAEYEVRERTKELEDTRIEIVNRLAMAGEYRDDATGEHTRRVGRNAAIMAYMLGWPEENVQMIFYAARLHDVGKIGIRDDILLKPGKLTSEEMEQMRSHTTKGAGILSGGKSKLLQMAQEIALYHHERWDGTGYPKQLSGNSIPQAARIVAIADVLDALTHQRVYKEAWSLEDALAEIKKGSGSHFDPFMVELALRVFSQQDRVQQLSDSNWEAFYGNLDSFLHF